MKARHLLFVSLFVAGTALTRMGSTQSDRLVAVVNADNSVQSVTVAELRNIYLGRIMFWESNLPVQAFDRPETTTAGRTFLAQIMEMTPARYRHYWQGAQLAGQGLAPRRAEAARSVARHVADSRGAVSYVMESETGELGSRVRVVPIR